MSLAVSTHSKRMGSSQIFTLLSSVAVLAILVFVVPYASGYLGGRVTIAESLRKLWSYEQWQHCWLVLPALAVVVYLQRKELAMVPAQGTLWGLVPLVGAFVFYWAGYRVENYYVGFFSIQLLIGGLILWFGGWKWLFTLLFAYGFLIFVWPLYFLENSITFPLRMVMSMASAGVLNFLGVPVALEGTGILSAPEPMLGLKVGQRFRVDVADPCSGIRSLFALMMVSALYGHFTLKTWWQKGILFLSSVPLAILGNFFRILMLTFGTMTMGPEIAIGRNPLTDPSWFHIFAGYLVFAVALGGMIGIALLLRTLPLQHAERGRTFNAERRKRQQEITTPGSQDFLSDSTKDLY